jgi:hypothetical protein
MFPRAKAQTRLEVAIDRALIELETKDVASAEYKTILERVETLYEVRKTDKPDRVSADNLATISANLVGIILIIRHEHVNVITSRAMGLVTKLR